ncbi:polyamine aminopropyltransferase [Caldanaerobius polysaccharolyticus]|uniref:polyamine aminopropyltransferase n=1 Tax=Caldanaerobius polysaccharolyticus TaxID=44256 RepID=UPI00047E5DB1|nr:polyamine aminopropyltransferase [Caldanaerobius polysaccharolyticus]
MELWFSESQTKDQKISVRVLETLYSARSDYQEVAVYKTAQYGTLLALDDIIQTTEKDEFVYHEMITHVALNTHANPERVLVIGGGDGGAIREVLKHKSVKKATLAEIDRMVVEVSKRFLPAISCALDDERADVQICDGIKYIQEHKNEFDVIIVDSTDPIGPAVGLFSGQFYKMVYDALKDDGIFVAQTESPFYNTALIKNIHNDLKNLFPIVRLYLATVPTYPGGLWTFTLGSKKYDPLQVEHFDEMETKYYSPEIHRSAFVLPNFVKQLVDER